MKPLIENASNKYKYATVFNSPNNTGTAAHYGRSHTNAEKVCPSSAAISLARAMLIKPA